MRANRKKIPCWSRGLLHRARILKRYKKVDPAFHKLRGARELRASYALQISHSLF